MADTFVKNPKLIVGTQAQVESEMGANDIGFATDVEFYTAKQIDELLEKSGGASLPILMPMWSDHVINNMSWLRADTFSWQAGSVYESAYQHLADDIDGKTLQSETIGSATIQFYLADDGHKICPASEESNVTAIYNATGVAWYFILDTVNKQFKLPRTKFGFTGLRDSVGGYVAPGLPNITGSVSRVRYEAATKTATGAFENSTESDGSFQNYFASTKNSDTGILDFDASLANPIYGNSDTVQQPATQMHLYFYVGNFEQSAIEQTAGINTELFNEKADRDLGNIPTNYDYVVESQMPTADNGYTWYRKYKSGWVEQGGQVLSLAVGQATSTVVFPQAFTDTNYTLTFGTFGNGYNAAEANFRCTAYSATGATFYNNSGSVTTYKWYACGMAA